MNIRFGLVATLAALLLGSLPAAAQSIACHDPEKPMLEIDLMFGRNIGGVLGVSEPDWDDFVAKEITPRFPEGLSVLEAEGQWRDSERKTIVHEPSKDVRIVVADDPGAEDKIEAIVGAYKQRFHQQSVGVVMRPACVAF